MTSEYLPMVGAVTPNPKAAAANAARIDAENKQGGKVFKVGDKINVRIHDGASPVPSVVEGMETGGWYGNIVVCTINGEQRRVSVQRVTRRKA